MQKEIETLLKNAGLKVTHARIQILEIFLKQKKPLCVPDILQNYSEFDKVTVYRSVNSFFENNILKKVDMQSTEMYYELAHEENEHHHIICTHCKRVEDIHDCDLEKLEKSLSKKSKLFERITHHSMEFYGICKSCEIKK